MNYKLINEALNDIPTLRWKHPKFKKVSDSKVDNLRGEERQGEYDEIVEIYSLGEDDLHLKLVLRTDSYGDNESIHSVQIVKPITKQITDFEPIK
jgi:hypothetical protein